MSLSLKESQNITKMTDIMYDFLPGSGRAQWASHVTFRSVADRVGVGSFCQAGSKRPMLQALLEKTLDIQKGKFENLVVEIIRAGIPYRQKNNNPITFEEIEQLNSIILNIGFKFPDLWDSGFLASLPREVGNVPPPSNDSAVQLSKTLAELKGHFDELSSMVDRSKAGLSLEKLLVQLFKAYGLEPRNPFRVTGEQIDGSFEFEHNYYLIEAKWERNRLPVADLVVFGAKIAGKSAITRGVFIAINGISQPAQTAIATGKQPNFFVMDGYDLYMILSEEIRLDDFLRRRIRLLAEEGLIVMPYSDLMAHSN
ncbi:MAG: restriction endonuclease [Armatimonadetes bacterium]|nr:restriction endonuclease [Armatimonadota bacterium]